MWRVVDGAIQAAQTFKSRDGDCGAGAIGARDVAGLSDVASRGWYRMLYGGGQCVLDACAQGTPTGCG